MSPVTFILFILGFGLLVGGAELLVRGASRIAMAVGISPLVVGLTVVAYGTSTPELAVTLNAAYTGQSDLGLGNVVGSNISNILLVLGLASVVGGPLLVNRQLVRQELPLMIAISVAVLLLGWDGRIGRIDGLILTLGALAYTVFVIRKSHAETKQLADSFQPSIHITPLLRQVGMMVAGLALLVIGANWLIDGAVTIAELLGVSKLVIGLTVVAVGTSLPEIATSIIASLRRQRDIAVGNAVGSNLFNLLLVLGLTAAVAPNGVTVSPAALTFDIPVMIAVAVAALPIFFTGFRIDRWEGCLLLAYYAAYTAYLFLNATQHYLLNGFVGAMVWGIIPLTALTLASLTIKALRHNANGNGKIGAAD